MVALARSRHPLRTAVRKVARRSTRGMGAGSSWRLVRDDGVDFASGEPFAPVEEPELDEEGEADDLAPEPLRQLKRGLGGSAGREHVVDDEDLLAGPDGVAVDLEEVGSVLELVFRPLDL